MKRLIAVLVITLVMAGLSSIALAAGGWVTTDTGVKVWSNTVQAGDSAIWSGGRDTERLADGSGVLQYYRQGKRQGTLFYTYDGIMQKGKFNGQGKMSFVLGYIYEGSFVDGSLSGKGSLKWPNGTFYEGAFDHGSMTGKGIKKYTDGTRYEGEFLDGNRHGAGIQYDKNGKILIQGKWQQDKFIG
jgi:hypothetical protein